MKMPRIAIASSCILAAVALGGRATAYEGNYNYRDGWRKGRVVELASYDKLSFKPRSDCSQVTGRSDKPMTFAIIGYQGGASWSNRIVAVPDGAEFKPNDLVYVNVKQCMPSLIARN